jgi:transposase
MVYSGCRIHFLPPYAPELNPIEESFAAGEIKSALQVKKLTLLQ